MAGYGVPHDDIARSIGIAPRTSAQALQGRAGPGAREGALQNCSEPVPDRHRDRAESGHRVHFLARVSRRVVAIRGATVAWQKEAARVSALEPDMDTELGRLIAQRAEHSH